MDIRIVERFESLLPADDDHPYRTGPWRPNTTEYDATGLTVIAGAIPRDLAGIYLRNTENPIMPALGRYHPFDGDGMLHAVHFSGGRAHYRNRFVRTPGFEAERAAGEPLWAGIAESPELSKREGHGARTRMKDAGSTDVVVHRGTALTSFYQCGQLHRMDARTLEAMGTESWGGKFPAQGVSAHTKVDENNGELLFFNYSKQSPFMSYGVVDARGDLVHHTDIPLPGPRLPHDMAFTENFAVLNDFPLFWDPALLAKNVHRARFHRDLPSRFAVIPRRGGIPDIRWFEASPTYALHFVNAYEDGDEIVLDGYPQSDPLPVPRREDGPWGPIMAGLDVHRLGTRLHRWRFDLRTGTTRESFLDDTVTEFPSINGRYGGRKYRYTYAMTGEPGWFLFNGLVKHDVVTSSRQEYRFPKGVFASESPMAPRVGSTTEDDGYVVTFVTDMNRDCSECQLFDARDISAGPIARVLLPERISSGTHACWVDEKDLPAGQIPSGPTR